LSNRARQTAQATSASITARLFRDLYEEFEQIDAERTGYDEQFDAVAGQAPHQKRAYRNSWLMANVWALDLNIEFHKAIKQRCFPV
jgi:hypothetical protein